MLLAEDLLLLLTDDATGKLLLPAEQIDIALGGANLLELTLLELVGLDDGKHVGVFDQSSTGDPILDGALGVISARQGRKPKAVVEPLGRTRGPRCASGWLPRVSCAPRRGRCSVSYPFTAGRP